MAYNARASALRKKYTKEFTKKIFNFENNSPVKKLLEKIGGEIDEFTDTDTGETISNKEFFEILNNMKPNEVSLKEKKMGTSRRTGGKDSQNKKREVVFAEGVIMFQPHENAPDFVLGKICISLDSFTKWAEENEKYLHKHSKYGEQVILEIKRSKDDIVYAQVETPREKK